MVIFAQANKTTKIIPSKELIEIFDSAFELCVNTEFPRKLLSKNNRLSLEEAPKLKQIKNEAYYALKMQNGLIPIFEEKSLIDVSSGVTPLISQKYGQEKYSRIYEPVVRAYFEQSYSNEDSVPADNDIIFGILYSVQRNPNKGEIGEKIIMRVLQRASMKKNILQGLYLENEDFLPSDKSFLENCKFDVRVSGLLEEFEDEDFEMFGDEWSKDDENIYALTWKDPSQNWNPLARAIQVKNSAHVDIWTFAWYTQQSNLKAHDNEIPIPCAIQVKNWGEDSRMTGKIFLEALESLNPARFYSNTVKTQKLWSEKWNQINFKDGYIRIIVCFAGFTNSVVNSVKE